MGVPLTKDPAAVALEEISMDFRLTSSSIVIKGMSCFVGLIVYSTSRYKYHSELRDFSII